MTLIVRDIPQDGQDFEWTENNTTVKGFIYPIKGGFDLSGEVFAKVPMDCSFCANTIQIPIKEKFHEVILSESPKPVFSGKEGEKEIILHKDDLEVVYVDGPEIDLRPLIDQIIGVAIPLQPKCVEKGAPAGFPECIADWDYTKYYNEMDQKIRANPFEALKDFKNN